MSKSPFSPACLAVLFLVCLFFAVEGIGQTTSLRNKQKNPRPFPAEFRRNLSSTILSPSAAPPWPVHSCAEWEESEGIILNYGWMNADTVNKMQMDHQVYIQVDNLAAEYVWINFLNNNGIPLTNIHFIMIPVTYGWMRDCGPWFIWDGNNELCIVNNSCWHDNYPLDDLFPMKFAARYGYKYYEPMLKIYCEGGNYYPNAYGIAISSSWVYGDNQEKSKALTDSLFKEYLGIERYLTVPPYTLSHHDTCGKPANPETMIIAQWPEEYWKHPLGEGIAAYYETLESPWGRPYKIHRIPMFPMVGQDFKPYLNCLVANKKVFVPITFTPDDQIALRIFQDAFVGYEIVGIDHFGTGWGASLHCATKLIMKRDIIRIYPLPPGDTEDTNAGYTVKADVIPLSGSSLLQGYPVIHWTDTGGAPFNDVVMLPTGQPDEYEADIPAQPQGTGVSFYIEARDDGGRTADYPLVAPDGMMTFQVREDLEAPKLSRFIPTRSASAGQWPPLIRTLCKDDMATPEVRVEYAINGVPQPDVQLTREDMCYWYSGPLGGKTSAGDLITYRVKATDNAVSANLSYLPMLGEVYCPVAGPGESVGIVNRSPRPYTAPFLLDTLGDLGIPHHYYRDWPADFGEHDVWFICLGVFPYNHILSTAEASDIVTALKAGRCIYLEGGDTWCYDPEKDKLKPWFGVNEISRGWSVDDVKGAACSILDGLSLKYADETEDLCIDRFSEVPPAEPLLRVEYIHAVAVINDPGRYRTIASSIPLGSLSDGEWPDIRKEILVRYLKFFGIGGIQLMATSAACQGKTVPVRLRGTPGDEYLLLASLAENYLPCAYGVCRLSFDHLFVLAQGVIPPTTIVEYELPIPRNGAFLGLEVHLQGLTGKKVMPPQDAQFTNREILTVVK